MAIALRAVGARTKADVGVSGGTQTFALPTGHVSGDLLVLVIVTDSVTGVSSTPSGWTKLGHSGPTGFYQSGKPYARVDVYWRIDTGSLGASVSVSFSSASYPTGSPYVLGCVVGYSGTHQTTPIVEWDQSFTTATDAALAHPQLTTNDANDWLLTVRAVSDATSNTFTSSVGTDSERVDDTDGFNELSLAIYDSNAALAAGLQTQRTTTASTAISYGSSLWSIAIRPPSPVASVFAAAGSAEAVATAYDATVTISQPTTWSACESGNGAFYRIAVDWDADGTFLDPGTLLTRNLFFNYGLTGWTGRNYTVALDSGFQSSLGITVVKVTPNGSSSFGGLDQTVVTAPAVVAGNDYTARAWVYSPAGWADMRTAIDWYDASGTNISSSFGAVVAVAAGTWTLLEGTLTAPDGAVKAVVRARQNSTPAVTDVWYVWGLAMLDPLGSDVQALPAPDGLITESILSGGISIDYGRDQARQLNPGKIGTASLNVTNADGRYSPENVSSPLTGDLDPARMTSGNVEFLGTDYPLFRGRINDFTINAARNNRSVAFSFQDDQAVLQGVKLSTGFYQGIRTGEALGVILDIVGWTGGRDIDLGATVMPYWWVEGTDALSAVNDLVASEGPPSIAYVDPAGTFVFRDRHHRLLRAESVYSQAAFAAAAVDCDAPAVTGYSYTDDQFTYQHGWRDIVNSASFDVDERRADTDYSAVWTSDSVLTVGPGETVQIQASASDPFIDLQDLTTADVSWNSGSVVLSAAYNRRTGQSVTISLTATGGTAIITYMQIRARSVPVVNTRRVSFSDTSSISRHGERTYPNDVPWAGVNDAYAVAQLVVSRYAERRPTVTLSVSPKDPAHFVQILRRTISDRITIVNGELGLDSDFFIESVSHTIQRIWSDRPPVHTVTFGCEKDASTTTSAPFTFDVKGAGFNQGVFDPTVPDAPDTVFIWDDPDQGQFDFGKFGT
jgi:hypothetical protein